MPPARSTRRRVVRTAALLTVLAASGAGVASVMDGGPVTALDRPQPAVAPNRLLGGSVLQIVAHPDDDLFFMNPDLSRSLSSGHGATTAYLTSGESDGVNAATGPRFKDPRPRADRAGYAEARQNGIRAAYAQMATGDRSSPWRRTVVNTAGGGRAEVDVLVARPQVNLVWLQLQEARNINADRPVSLRGLWDGRIARLGSVLSSGSPVKAPYAYTKEQVIRTVAGLMERYRPTTIRIQDPTPGRSLRSGKLTDHQDHMYGARFAQAAAARYAQYKNRPHFTVQNYLGYLNSSLPHVLDPGTTGAKLRILKTYSWTDHQDYCDSPAGCGDRKVAGRPTGNNWVQSQRYTRGESTSWLVEGSGGDLYAFAVLDGQLGVWHRTGARGRWTGPELLPGAGLDPGAQAVRLPGGRLAVYGVRTTLGPRPADYRREVVLTEQTGPGGAFGPWQSLGTPETSDARGTSAISAPAPVVLDGSGRMAVYVRDSRRTLRVREQLPEGTWSRWRALGGADLQSDPVAAKDSGGRRYVVAATSRSVLAWYQRTPDGPLTGPFPTGLPATTLPLSVLPEGRAVRLLYRKPDSGAVRTVLLAPGAVRPLVSPALDAGANAGYGAVGAAGRLLAGRADTGTVGVAPRGAPPAWTESEVLFAGAPAGAAESSGAISLAVVGLDAELHWTTYPAGGRSGRAQPWRPAVAEPADRP
ncbi:PIG-L family deacetylase [Streptomyces sp. NPDC089919]|uniref:PIG-L family deacetylase n=1 Tax=Streptomyces sp. NPDC089919 TaxID=3155188 RepID=UPI00342F79C9